MKQDISSDEQADDLRPRCDVKWVLERKLSTAEDGNTEAVRVEMEVCKIKKKQVERFEIRNSIRKR